MSSYVPIGKKDRDLLKVDIDVFCIPTLIVLKQSGLAKELIVQILKNYLKVLYEKSFYYATSIKRDATCNHCGKKADCIVFPGDPFLYEGKLIKSVTDRYTHYMVFSSCSLCACNKNGCLVIE